MVSTTKLLLSLFCFFILSSATFCVSHGVARSVDQESMRQRYHQWIRRYGRVYTSPAEKKHRFQIFKSNVKFIDAFNRDDKRSFELGVNQFADMTNEEFRAYRNGFKPKQHKKVGSRTSSRRTSTPFVFKYYENGSSVPSSVDWRKEGAVTPVKNQGQCGCCWAFSAVAAVEGITKLKTGKLVSLSEQELVDCDTAGENKGCEGGLMDNAFKFIKQNGGLTTEVNYPYKGADGTCDSNSKSRPAAKISGYEDVPANSEESLMKAVAKQPVSVAIDAGGLFFQFYLGGVFSGFCGTNLDHGVTAVGYGTSEDGTKYWLVKNSWGSSWGEKGYIRMQRDVDGKEGLCGIAMQASYPTA